MRFSHFLKRAQAEKWAIGQFNVANLETLKAVFSVARKLTSPVIIGTSEGESAYLGLAQAVCLVRIFEKEFSVPAILNLDHGRNLDYIKKAIGAGYDAIHFDGSNLPLSENIKVTRQVVSLAHKKGILVEGELGQISGASELWAVSPETKPGDLTDAKDAEQFVRQTKVDSLAVNIGAFHGMAEGEVNPEINLTRLKAIKERVGDSVFLVMHGGSGLDDKEVKEAIRIGMVKININTELRLAFKMALAQIAKEGFKEIAAYKYMPAAIEAVAEVVERKIKLFGSGNKVN